MSKRLIEISIATFCAVAISGCAGTAQYLRSQPSAYYNEPASDITLADKDLSALFHVKCMKAESKDSLAPGNQQSPQCLYVSVDAAKVSSETVVTRSIRDKAIAYLISVSDANCSNFLDRAFANKAGLDVSKSLSSDLATGVSAATAFNTPAVSAGLGLANLVVGKTVDNINSPFYFDKTFQAFEAAVLTERARIKSEIIARQATRPLISTNSSAVQYGIFDALADMRTYDDACSMRAGLAKLIETASALKQAQTLQSAQADTKAATDSLAAAKVTHPAVVPPSPTPK